ncbi:MAG: LysR family transcriptional regulator [Pseudomonadota bacterium]
MEMHQARYFLAVCETLNFTRAAEQCHVAQPSLTKAIKKLEDELGGELFRRERARTHLTDLGRMMKPHLEQVVESAQRATKDAVAFRTRKKAPLKLGVMCTVGPRRLIPILRQLEDELPTLDLKLHESSGEDVVASLMDGDIDIAVAGLAAYPERIDATPLFSERYVVAVPKDHRFARMNAVPVAELAGEPYLERLNCEFESFFDALDGDWGGSPIIRYSSGREDWIQSLVKAGMGCSIMPESMPMMSDITTRLLVEPEVTRTVHMLTVAGRRHTPTVETFTRLARRHDWASAL